MAKKIQDFGEKIGGARKDLWRHRGLLKEDILDFNLSEILEHVVKKNIWIEPKWKTLQQNGYDKDALYVIKFIRDALPSKPDIENTLRWELRTKSEEETRQNILVKCSKYINMINSTKEVAMRIKSKDDCSKAFDWLYNKAFEMKANKEEPVVPYYDMAELGSGLSRLLFEREVQDFPNAFRGDLKGLAIKTYRYTTGKKVYVVSINRKTVKSFDTEEDAKNFCLSGDLVNLLDSKKRVKKVSKVVKVVRPQLERIERIGPNIRHNENVTGELILDVFNFRGGEFGNWNTDDDRQACLNYVYDAMQDLAFCMNTTPKFIGLGEELRDDNV